MDVVKEKALICVLRYFEQYNDQCVNTLYYVCSNFYNEKRK